MKEEYPPGSSMASNDCTSQGRPREGSTTQANQCSQCSYRSGTWNLPYSGNRLMATHMKLKQRFWAEGTDVLAQLFGISV